MADGDNLTTAAVSTATTSPQSTSKKEKKNKQPRSKPSHPPTADMVINAIKSLKERGGSSLQAIKKYISTNYKVDAEKIAPFIKKYLKSAVISGKLIQTKGKGASGSFKLASVTSMAGNKPLTTKKKPTSPKIKKIQKKSSTKKVIVGSDNKSLISKKTSIKNRKVSSVGNVAEGKSTLKKKTLVGTEKKGKRIISNVDKKTSIGGSASTTVKETVKVKSPSSKARKTTKAGIAIKKLKVPKPKSTKNVSGASKVKKVASPKKKK